MYVTLKEAEYRSVAIFPYWKVAVFNWIVPRQRRVAAALKLINATLNDLIAQCKVNLRSAFKGPVFKLSGDAD